VEEARRGAERSRPPSASPRSPGLPSSLERDELERQTALSAVAERGMIGPTVADSPDSLTEIEYRAHYLLDKPGASRKEREEELRGIADAVVRLRRERARVSERIARIEAEHARIEAEQTRISAQLFPPERPALRLIPGGG
jgi:chromosome segregation ATPase